MGSTEQWALEGPPDKGEETITLEGWHKDHDAELRDWGRAKRHSTHHRGLNIVSILAIVRGQYWVISSVSGNSTTLSFMFCTKNRRHRVANNRNTQLHGLPPESLAQGVSLTCLYKSTVNDALERDYTVLLSMKVTV